MVIKTRFIGGTSSRWEVYADGYRIGFVTCNKMKSNLWRATDWITRYIGAFTDQQKAFAAVLERYAFFMQAPKQIDVRRGKEILISTKRGRGTKKQQENFRKRAFRLPAEEKRKDDSKPIEAVEPNWNRKCDVCGAIPIVPITGMCGPCTFKDPDTANGNW